MIPLAETPIYSAMMLEQAMRDLCDRALASVRQAWNAFREFIQPVVDAFQKLAAALSTHQEPRRKPLIHNGRKP